MFRHRPRPGTTENASTPDKAHGFLFVARQGDLTFGSDRREPVEFRPVVSLQWRTPFAAVLPSTTKPNPDFFHLRADQCFYKESPANPRDSYLCPRYETVRHERLRETGVVPQNTRVDIARWLKRARRGD